MTPVTVKVALVDAVREHPNADKLEIVDVLGWQLVVPKGTLKQGKRVVYFPPDTCIPAEWADKFGVRKYLKGPENDRVGRIKLRGEPSFGLAVTPPEDWQVGQEVSEYFGAWKYEPPIRATCGDAEREHPLFPRYTDIENLRNYPDVFESGELVCVTEKIHGTNVRIGIIDGQFMAGSKTTRRKFPDGPPTIYWWPWFTEQGVAAMLAELGRTHRQAVLYGEIFGRSVQALSYGIGKGEGYGFAVFDLLLDGVFQSFEKVQEICDDFGVRTVPTIACVPYDIGTIRGLAEGKSRWADHIREGVVVRPREERIHPKVGRLVMKFVSDSYLVGNFEDNTDV